MSLGYDVYDDSKRSFEQPGLTGEVKRYVTVNMEFPCFVICNTDEQPVKRHSLEALKMMFPRSKQYDESTAQSMIHLYFNHGDKTAKLGVIQPNQVKTLLRLFKANVVDGYLERDYPLKGDYRYILSEWIGGVS